jgi:Ni/Fe-hydrogenase subunit HybB-like protein
VLFILPLFILSFEKYRSNPQLLFVAATSMLLGGMLYRFNAFLIGYNPGPGYHYFPSITEILASMGLVSMEIMAFIVFVKKLPILSRPEPEHI